MTPDFIVKGEVSQEFAAKARRSFLSLPEHIQAGLLRHEFSVKVGPSMPDLHPELFDRAGAVGFMAPTVKTIFLAEKSLQHGEWSTANNPVEGNLFHEAGHFIALFMKGTGDYRDGDVSDQAEFTKAFKNDLDRMVSTNFAQVDALGLGKGQLQYFEKYYTNNPTGRHEVYAELWAQLNGRSPGTAGLATVFPDSAAIVKKHDDELRAAYQASNKKTALSMG